MLAVIMEKFKNIFINNSIPKDSYRGRAIYKAQSNAPQKKALFISSGPIFFHILIALRYSTFNDTFAVLLCDKKNHSNLPYLKKFYENGIFDEIIYLDLSWRRLKPQNKYWNKHKTKLESYICKKIDTQFKTTPYTIDSFDHIVVPVDVSEWLITLYLHIKSKPFYVIEAIANHFDKQKRSQSSGRANLKEATDLVTHYDSWNFTTSALAIPFFHADSSLKNLECSSQPRVKFDFKRELSLLPSMIKTDILNAYGFDFREIGIDSNISNGIVYLPSTPNSRFRGDTSAVTYAKVFLNSENPRHFETSLHQLAIDYFMDESQRIYIKKHPTTVINTAYIDEYFPSCSLFPDTPGEFLSFCESYKNHRWDSTITFKDNYGFAGDSQNQIILSRRHFPELAFRLHKLYFAFSLLSNIKIRRVASSTHKNIAPFFIKHHPEIKLVSDKNIAQHASKIDLLILDNWDSWGDYPELHQDKYLEKITLLVLNADVKATVPGLKTQEYSITKRAIRLQGILFNTSTETFYILSKDSRAKGKTLKKELLQSGLSLKCSST